MRNLSPVVVRLLSAPVWCAFGYYHQVPFPGGGSSPGPDRSRLCLAY